MHSYSVTKVKRVECSQPTFYIHFVRLSWKEDVHKPKSSWYSPFSCVHCFASFSKLGCPNLLLSSISRQNSHLNKMSVCLMGIVNESRLWSWSCLSIISTRWLSKSNWDFSHIFNRLLPSSFDAANNFVNQWEVKQHNESFWLNAFHVRLLQCCLPLNFVISFKNCSFKRILAIRQSCLMATGYWNIRGTNNNE